MKKIAGLMLVFTVLLVSVFAWAAGGPSTNNTDWNNKINSVVKNLPNQELSIDEINGLLLMREEEKLARDVYLTFYDKWNLRIFSNIAKAEQTHTNAVKVLLDKYGIEDPVKDDTRGVFTDKHLQDLYNKLVARGNASLMDALMVGATVEDLDIFDLENLLSKTDNKDIKIVYKNLTKGSRNHLRSYVSQIERNGGTYKAQYLTEDEIKKIVSTPHEKGAILK